MALAHKVTAYRWCYVGASSPQTFTPWVLLTRLLPIVGSTGGWIPLGLQHPGLVVADVHRVLWGGRSSHTLASDFARPTNEATRLPSAIRQVPIARRPLQSVHCKTPIAMVSLRMQLSSKALIAKHPLRSAHCKGPITQRPLRSSHARRP